MIRIRPQILPKSAKLPKQNLAAPRIKSIVDISDEENGYFKVGDRIIKTIFPR